MVLQFYLKSSQRTVHILGNYGTVVQHSMFQIYLKDNEKMHLCFMSIHACMYYYLLYFLYLLRVKFAHTKNIFAVCKKFANVHVVNNSTASKSDHYLEFTIFANDFKTLQK